MFGKKLDTQALKPNLGRVLILKWLANSKCPGLASLELF
jgi:hypothetical protein